MSLRRDFKRTPLDLKDQKKISELSQEQSVHRKKLDKIDQEMIAIQRSTRTLIPQMASTHHYLRSKYPWYYRWYLKSCCHKVHGAILVIFLLVLFFGFVGWPFKQAEAAGNTCQSEATGNWSNAATWTDASCGVGGVPGDADNAVINNTHTVTMTGAVALGTGSVTVNTGGILTTGNYSLSFTNMSISGTFNAGSSTITASGNWDSSVGTVSVGTSMVEVTGSGTITTKSWNNTFYDLKTAYTGQTVSWVNNGIITHQLILFGNATGSLSITSPNGPTISATGATWDSITTSGATVSGTGRILFTGGAGTIIPATITYPSLVIVPTSSTHKLGGNISSTSLYIYGAAANTATLDLDGKTLTTTSEIEVGSTTNTRYGKIVNTSVSTDSTLTVGGYVYIRPSDVNSKNILDASGTRTINISVATNWTNNDTFTAGASTVIFNRTNADQTITTSATTQNNTFYNLTINNTGASGSDDIVFSGTLGLDVNGKLTITDGDLSPAAFNTTIAGGLEFTHATNGSWDRTGGGTLTFDGTGTWTDAGTTKRDLGTMTVNGAAAVLTLGSSVRASVITIAADDQLNLGASGYTLDIDGDNGTETVLIVNGTLTPGTSTVKYSAVNVGGSMDITVTTYNSLEIAGADIYDLGGNLTGVNALTGNLTIDNGASLNTWDDPSYNITCVNLTNAGTLGANASTITLSGNWTNSNSFTAGTSTVTFSGGGTSLLTSGGTGDTQDFATIGISNVTTLRPQTNGLKSATLNVTSGTLDMATNDQTLTVTGTLTVSAGQNYSTGTAAQTIATLNNSGNVTCEGAGANGTNLQITTFTNNNGSLWTYTNGAAATVRIGTYHDLTLNDAGGGATYTLGVGTTNASGTLTITGGTLAIGANILNVTESVGNSDIITISTGTLDIDTNFAVGTLTCSGAAVINIAGNWSSVTSFTALTSTVTFDGGLGVTQQLDSGGMGVGKLFNNLVHSNVGTLQLVTNNLDINGNFTNSSGTFDTNGKDMTVAGNFDDTGGLFTPGTRTVTLDGSGAQSFTAGGTGAGKTLYNLTITNASGAGVTFNDSLTLDAGGTFDNNTPASTNTFKDGSTYTFPIINIDGAVGQQIILKSSAPGTAWLLNVAAALPTVTFVNVSDSNAAGGSQIIANDGTSLDSGGNTNWLLSHNPVNDSLTFTNPYGGAGNTAVADDTTEWTFQTKVTDVDGPTNLNYVELRLANATDSVLPYDSLKFRWTEGGLPNPFSEVADTQNAATITSTVADAAAVGNQWTLNFKVKINNNFLAKDTQYNAELYSVDDVGWSDDDDYANKYQVTALSITFGLDSASINLGTLFVGIPVTATTVATVTTNYSNGYVLQVSDGIAGNDSALLHTNGTTRIADYVGTIALPTLWSGTGLGISVFSATGKEAKWGTGVTVTDAQNAYAGIPQAATTIHTKTGAPTSSDQTSVGYKLDVPVGQLGGYYSGNVTYTVTGVL